MIWCLLMLADRLVGGFLCHGPAGRRYRSNDQCRLLPADGRLQNSEVGLLVFILE